MATGTILEKPELTDASEDAFLYLVYNNQDYHATVAAILNLITKSRIGLGNVDNTSDVNKPISQAAVARFSQIDTTLQNLLTSVEQILGTVNEHTGSLTAINALVEQIQEALANKTSPEDVLQIVNTAISNLVQTVNFTVDRVTDLEIRFNAFQDTLGELVAQAVAGPIEAQNIRITAFETSVNDAIAGKANSDHSHTAASITDFGQAVQNELGNSDLLIVGTRGW